MRVALQARINPSRNICQRKVLKSNPKGVKTECVFADGTSILLSNFLTSFIRAGDELLLPLDLEATAADTEIYIRHNPEERKQDVFQASIGYATQPRKDRRDNLFVSAEIHDSRLGISAINLRCEALRDYFYVGNRRRAWDRQASFYELLRVNPKVSPTELRLAFKLRTLELRTAHAQIGDLRTLERAFNILARPELRACYDTLLNDPGSPALFPCGGFGSLLVAGHCSRDGSTFHASRILSFLPEQKFKQFRAPLRKVEFYKDHAIYRDSRRKLEIFFDQASLPLLWDSSWNQWKHLLGAKIGIKATFTQSGKYQHRADTWHLVKWETTDVAQITWKPDYDVFYYKQLCKRARHLYLFRSEYIFDLEKAVIVETPRLGHATYLFSRLASMPDFLAIYRNVTKDDVRHDRGNVGERLGFLSRIIHGHNPRAWMKELKMRLGEPVDYAEALD